MLWKRIKAASRRLLGMKPASRPSRWMWLDLVLVLAVALVLGMLGGPSRFHPDTIVEKALRTLAQGGNPRFFNYPALVLYLDGYLYQAWLGWMHIGPVQPVDWFLAAVQPGSQVTLPVFAPAHLVTLFFSLLGVASTHLAAYRLARSRRLAGLAASLLLATSLLWASDAHFMTVDTPMTSLGMATVALTLFFTTRPGETPTAWRFWQVILVGVLGGLTAAAKYNGALVLLAPVAVMFLQTQDKWKWYGHTLLLGAAAAAAFFATNPFILQDSVAFWRDFQYELDHARLGHPGFTTDQGWLFHLQTTLPNGIGLAAMALAAAGMAVLLFSRAWRWSEKLGLLLFPLAQFWVIGSSHLAFQRYALPLLPFAAILVALALLAFSRAVGRRIPRLQRASLALAGLVWLAAILPNLRNVLQSDTLLGRTDTRLQLAAMLQATGLSETRTPGFAGMYTDEYFNNRFQGSQSAANRAEIYVMDSFSHDRWMYDLSTRLQIPRARLAGYAVVQITPYSLPRQQIAVSPQSIYSPYLPDLYDRNLPGPFIEIYLPDADLAQELVDACQRIRASCTRLPAPDGYYYQQVMQ